jgi:hypothetical protein
MTLYLLGPSGEIRDSLPALVQKPPVSRRSCELLYSELITRHDGPDMKEAYNTGKNALKSGRNELKK